MRQKQSLPSDEAVSAWANLMRVSQALLDRVESDLKAAGMPPLAWYDVLLELDRAEPSGIRAFELQKQILVAQYNLSRLVDRIEAAGYAERLPCSSDGRCQVLRITAKGRAVLQKMRPVYRDTVRKHFASKLAKSETGQLLRSLEKLA